jgi:hypothetical protein
MFGIWLPMERLGGNEYWVAVDEERGICMFGIWVPMERLSH